MGWLQPPLPGKLHRHCDTDNKAPCGQPHLLEDKEWVHDAAAPSIRYVKRDVLFVFLVPSSATGRIREAEAEAPRAWSLPVEL